MGFSQKPIISVPRKGSGFPLYQKILMAMVLGLGVGLVFGTRTAPLGELGKWVIQLIKAAATPLLFLTIVNSILQVDVQLKAVGKMMTIVMINAFFAMAIGLGLSAFFRPGEYLRSFDRTPPAAILGDGQIDFSKIVEGYFPKSIVQPFAENNIIALVMLALLFGFGLKTIRSEGTFGRGHFQFIEDLIAIALKMFERILSWIIHLIPFAVFGVVSKAVGQYGLAPAKGLGVYLLVVTLGFLIHILVTYQIWLFIHAKMNFKIFWKNALDAVTYALGANSSLATLPVTLKSLSQMGVSKESATLGACIGSNLNHDGIILYEAMAVLFVAQAYGLHLSLGQQVLASLYCVISAIGIAGVPEAGFISLSLVLSAVGLPTEILPLLLTVDWIVARGRSATNVLNEMTTSVVLDTWTPKK